jgi:thioredoxin 1
MPHPMKFTRFSFLSKLLAGLPAKAAAILPVFLLLAAFTAQAADRIIYPEPEQAQADLSAALKTAAATHKHVIVDFGGNWCGDCQVLQIYFHDPANWNLLQQNYVLVPVNIGRYDENLDIAARYGVPVTKGVPALAVLEPSGQLIYSQRNAEFEAMRKINSASVTAFLLRWKG